MDAAPENRDLTGSIARAASTTDEEHIARENRWKQEFGRELPTTKEALVALAWELQLDHLMLEKPGIEYLVPAIEGVLRRRKAENSSTRSGADTDFGDTRSTTNATKKTTSKKKPKRVRPMTKATRECARIYRRQLAKGDRIAMKWIVADYVNDNGGSVTTILRILSDHEHEWEVDHNTT